MTLHLRTRTATPLALAFLALFALLLLEPTDDE